MADRLVSVELAAKRLGVSRTLVYKLLRQGDLKSLKVAGARRIPLSALEEYMAQAEVGV